MAWFGKEELTIKPGADGSNTPPPDGGAAAEFKLPEAEKKRLETIEQGLSSVQSKFGVLDDMANFLKEQKEERQRKEAEARAARAAANTTELDEKWLTDPRSAAREEFQPLISAQIRTNSKLLANETFSDDKNFEFYHGDFKQEVDKLIATLPLSAAQDVATIKNCYNVVLGMKHKDIMEGKVKSKFAAAAPSSAPDTKTSADPNALPSLTDMQKRAAHMLGIKEEAYAKSLKEMSYV